MTKRRILITLIISAIMLAGLTVAASAATYSPYKTGKVTADPYVNVRAEASTDSAARGTLSKGTAVTLKGYTKTGGYKWYRITYKGKKGYIREDCAKKITAYPYTIYTPKKYGKVTADPYLNVRSKASTSASAIGKLNKGAKIKLKGYKGDWYRISYNGKAGYVSKDYVKRISKSEYKKKSSSSRYHQYDPDKYGKITASEGVNVRKSASTKGTLISSLDRGTKIKLKGYKYNGSTKWYRMYYSGTYGYICAKYVEKIAKSSYKKISTGTYHNYDPDRHGRVTTACLNVRAKASSSSKKLGQLYQGDKKILYGYRKASDGDCWYKVRINGQFGYVSAEFVKRITKSEYYKKSSSKPVTAPKVDGSGLGKKIVEYAFQFQGVPYVWAGESPSGFDCSGFVKYVFGHYNIYLPHSSWDIENYGTGVSLSNAKPGDVVCYGEHVGIYIGNGQMIHASSSAGCIAVGSATYRSIKTIRHIAH